MGWKCNARSVTLHLAHPMVGNGGRGANQKMRRGVSSLANCVPLWDTAGGVGPGITAIPLPDHDWLRPCFGTGIMKKVLLVLLAVAAVGAGVWFKFGAQSGINEKLTFPADAEYAAWIGKPAELSFTSLDGRRVASADLRGKVVLLDFWATWCGPCIKSLDHLKGTYQQFHEQGLEVVAINFDDDRAAVESVVKSKQLPWPQYFEGRENSLGRKFGITHYPSVWLLDKAGNVRYISALTDTDTKIKTLLAETEAEAAAGRGRKSLMTRLTSGIAALRGLKDGAAVRARTAGEAEPAAAGGVAEGGSSPVPSATLNLAAGRLKLRSVVVSSRSSAVIHTGDSNQFVSVGEVLRVETTSGRVELRVERIEPAAVTLVEVKGGTELKLRVK